MKIDYLKERKELVSFVLLGFSAVLAVSVLVKVTGFFTTSVKAGNIVEAAIKQNTEDANDIDKYFTEYKKLADALKKNNLFTTPPGKQHPVPEVSGIFGDEVIIRDKLYKVGDKIGDAKIISIEPTQVTIEWEGKQKIFSPLDSKSSSEPGRPGETARVKSPIIGGTAQMVTIQSQDNPTEIPDIAAKKMTEKFQKMPKENKDKFMALMKKSEEKYKKMSESEKVRFKSEMIEKFSGENRKTGGKVVKNYKVSK